MDTNANVDCDFSQSLISNISLLSSAHLATQNLENLREFEGNDSVTPPESPVMDAGLATIIARGGAGDMPAITKAKKQKKKRPNEGSLAGAVPAKVRNVWTPHASENLANLVVAEKEVLKGNHTLM